MPTLTWALLAAGKSAMETQTAAVLSNTFHPRIGYASFDKCGGDWFLLRRPMSLAGCAGWNAGDFLFGGRTRGKVVRGLKVTRVRGLPAGLGEAFMHGSESVRRRGGGDAFDALMMERVRYAGELRG